MDGLTVENSMRAAFKLLAFLTASALTTAASAQTVPNQLLGGSVATAIGSLTLRANCYVTHTPSSFQRNGLGTKAVITFGDITDGGSDLAGQAVLTFTSATGGTIHFKQYPAFTDPPFINYTQTYNTAALKFSVLFTISFSDCALPITAVFDLT